MYCRLRSRLCSALPGSAGFVVPRALGSGFGDLEFRFGVWGFEGEKGYWLGDF